METLIIKIKSKDKVAFTKELLGSFSFLEVEKEKKKADDNTKKKKAITQGFKELKLVEEGKLKAKPATELLKKLRNGKH